MQCVNQSLQKSSIRTLSSFSRNSGPKNSVGDDDNNATPVTSSKKATMRFLLHPVKRPLASLQKDIKSKGGAAGSLRPVVVNRSPMTVVSPLATTLDHNHVSKAWGQQCSQDCGCAVRFEIRIDLSSRKILGASYQAKTVIATPNKEGRLEPVYTTRTGRPMFKSCSCHTVHHLANKITHYLPDQTLDQARSTIEYSTSRSSSAFRHAVLADHGLPRTDTHCFDLVEEAFTAMIKGHMPKKRKSGENFKTILMQGLAEEHPPADDDGSTIGSEPQNNNQTYGIDRSELSMATSRNTSVLHMFDINAESWEYEQQQNHQFLEKQRNQKSHRSLDWVSYVDELYRKESA
jgi:hypothetical protein